MQHAAYENSVNHGWWEPPPEDGTVISLIHKEVSEVLDTLRTCTSHHESQKIPGFSNLEEELADVILQVMVFAERKKVRLGAAVAAKHEFNKKRPHRHGGKAF